MGAVATSFVIGQAGVLYPFWQRPCAKREDAKGAPAAVAPRARRILRRDGRLDITRDYISHPEGLRVWRQARVAAFRSGY